MANTNLIKNNYKLDIVKYRYLWLTITSILLIPCVIAIIYLMIVQPNHSPLKLGIDFTGGTILQYDIDRKASTDDLSKARNALVAKGIDNPVIQTTTQGALGEENYLLSIRTTFLGDKESKDKTNEITASMLTVFKKADLVQVNSIGPTLGAELLKNTLMALVFAFALMVYIFHLDFKLNMVGLLFIL